MLGGHQPAARSAPLSVGSGSTKPKSALPPSDGTANLNTTPRDPGPNSPLAKCLPATSGVVAFVGVQLLRAFAWATRAATGTTDRRDSVEHRFEQARVVNVSRRVPRLSLRSVTRIVAQEKV